MRLASVERVQAARRRGCASVLEALDCLRVAITVFYAGERLVYANTHYNYIFRSLPAPEADRRVLRN